MGGLGGSRAGNGGLGAQSERSRTRASPNLQGKIEEKNSADSPPFAAPARYVRLDPDAFGV